MNATTRAQQHTTAHYSSYTQRAHTQTANNNAAAARAAAHLEKLGVLDVGHGGEDARGRLVRLDDHVLVELLGLQAERLVERGALVVVEVHRDVHAQAEEARPKLGARAADHLGPRLEHGGEKVAVPVLVLAPVLKVLEERVELVVGVALQVAVDADVAPVADLCGGGCCVWVGLCA